MNPKSDIPNMRKAVPAGAPLAVTDDSPLEIELKEQTQALNVLENSIMCLAARLDKALIERDQSPSAVKDRPCTGNFYCRAVRENTDTLEVLFQRVNALIDRLAV